MFSPKTGLEPGRSCIDATAFFGSRSQLTTSANASLMRTPSWNTDSPCGVPSSDDAVKPRKLTSGWNAFPVGELSETLLALRLRNSATPPVRCRARSRAPNVCTFEGTCSSGVPSPGSGAVPTTSTLAAIGTTRGDCAAAAPALDRGCDRQNRDVASRGRQRIATPHGRSPTGISAIFVFVSVSITATALERPHAT